MFSKVSANTARKVTQTQCFTPLINVPKRFASDKAIRLRIDAVNNIKKITKAMKMVASAKVRRCEEALTISRNFSKGINDLWGKETYVLPGNPLPPAPVAPAVEGVVSADAPPPNSILVVPITPDRGLCGSVSAQVNRASKVRFNNYLNDNKDLIVLPIGERARGTLERTFFRNFAMSITEHSKLKKRTFKETSIIADYILQQKFENGEILYNKFNNMLTFETRIVRLPTFQQAIADPKLFEPYELEGNSDVLENFYQFSFAVKLNNYLCEGDMVEFSQRVNSMGNSSKSAEDMLGRLKLLYNRSRQSKITTELVEIISGASAADDSKLEE